MAVFRRTITVRFDEADARGVLFYGRVQALAHRVFEDFVVSELVERWEDWFESDLFVAPIRHAEATFHRPMRPGHSYDAELSVTKVGDSSFEVLTRFIDRAGPQPVTCAETRIVKALADPATWRKMSIPSAIRARLLAHVARE
ncbi:MAG TPA: acyl-CoA thioesterase [Vicinamibacterales bacterium]